MKEEFPCTDQNKMQRKDMVSLAYWEPIHLYISLYMPLNQFYQRKQKNTLYSEISPVFT